MGEYIFTFCRHPDFLWQVWQILVSFFGFFLLFDEVDDDEREEYDEQYVTLPKVLLRRTSGWYEKAVPEALSFVLLFTNSS